MYVCVYILWRKTTVTRVAWVIFGVLQAPLSGRNKTKRRTEEARKITNNCLREMMPCWR